MSTSGFVRNTKRVIDHLSKQSNVQKLVISNKLRMIRSALMKPKTGICTYLEILFLFLVFQRPLSTKSALLDFSSVWHFYGFTENMVTEA